MSVNPVALTGYQRVLNALNGTGAGAPPMAMVLSLYGSKLTACPAARYYSDPEAFVAGQDAVVSHYDPDIVTTPFALPFEGEAFGSELAYVDKMSPQLKRPAISSYSEIRSLQVPAFNAASKAYCLEAARLLAAGYKEKKFIAGFTLSTIDACTMIMGVEGFMDTLLFHQEEVKLLFEKTSRHFIDYTNALFDAGVDVVAIPSSFCSHTMVTEKIIETLTLEPLRAALQELKGPVIIHHGSAMNLKFLHYFADLPNVAGFVIDDRESLDDARKIVGDKLLLGNMNIAAIANKTPEALRKRAATILRDRRDDPRFVFMNAGPDVPYETPHENIAAVFEAVRDGLTRKTICIACGIFKGALEDLRRAGLVNVPVVYLDSMLHMKPEKLNERLSAEIAKYRDHNIILAYGECHQRMYEVEKLDNVRRLPGLHCGSIFLGEDVYGKLLREGAFILLPEWVSRWKEVFQEELGFKKADWAQMFMRDMHSKLVYLDLGDHDVPHDTLREISEFCGLPYFVEPCTSEELAQAIRLLEELFVYDE